MLVRDLQAALKAEGIYDGAVDSIYGSKTHASAVKYISKYAPGVSIAGWSVPRVRTAASQIACKNAGLDVGEIDGLIGPQTKYAFYAFNREKLGLPKETWRDYEPPKSDWPLQEDVAKYYGERGTNQTRLELPYPHIIAWDKSKVINHFSCHKKVADSIHRVMVMVEKEYGQQRIQELGLNLFGGCLNVRKMRGGTKWSMHSWGIAVDINPEKNAYHWGRDRALFAKPDYETWFEIWEAEGWISLGMQKNFDWMHVQAARLH